MSVSIVINNNMNLYNSSYLHFIFFFMKCSCKRKELSKPKNKIKKNHYNYCRLLFFNVIRLCYPQ